MNIKKGIIIHQGALGDLVCTVPALAALRSNCSELIGIGSERLKLLEYAGILDKALSAEALGLHQLFRENSEPGPYLATVFENAGLVVSWLGRSSKPFEANLKRLCPAVALFREPFPPAPGSAPACRILAQPVLELGIAVENFHPRIRLPENGEAAGRLPAIGARFLALHPGSGSPNKVLPLDKLFAILAQLAGEAPGCKLVIIAGDADKSLLIELIKRMPLPLRPIIQIIDQVDLCVLAETISRAEIYFGMDSGPTHLAAALGKKTVAVFGPTDPAVWAPPQPWVKIVTAHYPCAPCPDDRRRDCPKALCLEAVKEQEIITAIREEF